MGHSRGTLAVSRTHLKERPAAAHWMEWRRGAMKLVNDEFNRFFRPPSGNPLDHHLPSVRKAWAA